MRSREEFAWVTLTTNDTYSLGALVLAHSLKRAKTAHQLAVLVTPTVSQAMRDRLKEVYNVVQEVNVLDSQDAANLALLARPELGVTFTKLHCWRLVQFEKCVFLDADTLVLQNCDELFEREELSASPDVSWPDCFNSGVFVFKPSVDTFGQITKFAVKNGSFDGGDQGLLNQFFADWATADIKKHLPFVYNVTAYASYCYLPAFKQFRDKIKILHFAGKLKPWLIQFNSETRVANVSSDYAHAQDLIQLWWNIFVDNVIQSLSTEMAGLAGALSQLRIGEQRTPEQEDYENQMRRQCWESGQIDYSGADSFENIWKKISQTLEKKSDKESEETDNDNDNDSDPANPLSYAQLLNETASKLLHPPEKSLPSEAVKAKPAPNDSGSANGDGLDQPRPSNRPQAATNKVQTANASASPASASSSATLKQSPQKPLPQPETEPKPESKAKPKPQPQPQHITIQTTGSENSNSSSSSNVSKNNKQKSARKFK
ncbi:glycogenin-1 isoform X5 [Drosophila takahashii]|uniref:glycogenin-1 isoform X5 n=1 Tax=Drosophila takahashii TaxID=29030 RepID=UPI001CF86803|nr:glycogenin-1 isoform X5 [Drosophila takahashii]